MLCFIMLNYNTYLICCYIVKLKYNRGSLLARANCKERAALYSAVLGSAGDQRAPINQLMTDKLHALVYGLFIAILRLLYF